MDKKRYEEIIRGVSGQIAGEFLKKESNLAQRALSVDADIAEITRQIGSEAVRIIYEETVKQCTDKKNSRVSGYKEKNPYVLTRFSVG